MALAALALFFVRLLNNPVYGPAWLWGRWMWLVILLIMALGGCLTLARGTTAEVAIVSDPAGAHVELSSGERCETPCVLRLPRTPGVTVKVTRGGCDPVSTALVSRMSAGAAWLSGPIEYASGAAYELHPNPLTVRLRCEQK